MILIQETPKRIKFNSKVQMPLWAGFFVVCFGLAFFLLALLPEKIWQASEYIPSQSASACCWPEKHTYVNTHTQWPVSLVSLPHAYHQAAGTDASCSALLEKPENHRARLWSNANYSSLKKQREKEKKRPLLPIIRQTQTSVERERRRRRDRKRHSKSVKTQEVKWGKREERKEKKKEKKEGERDLEEEENVILIPLV